MKNYINGTSGLLVPPKVGGESRSRSASQASSGGSSAASDSTLSPELVPIVTLLSAQGHRRYHEGVFMILKDLNSDGTPGDRQWKEVYGVLIGSQLAVWNASDISTNQNDPQALMNATSKPSYINFTDSVFRTVNASEGKNMKNAIVVSTTVKNRYFLQFKDEIAFQEWHAALRLSSFEFVALQEAYTGAFLSTRGSRLSDIRVVLAPSKHDYEDWVSVRFGTGMPWKRCYAVVSQPKKLPKDGSKVFGEINFYENEKRTKKTAAMATISKADAVYCLYPSSPMLIDTSTMIKLEGEIFFSKKETPKPADIFVMPEKHHAVPGYDTMIRFLVPVMNTFCLYGRPKRLLAEKKELESLFFGLPTLPHIHYLENDDLKPLVSSKTSSNWSVQEWKIQIKQVLLRKLNQGYKGCGSSAGLSGALSSPALGSADLFGGSSPFQGPNSGPTSNRSSIIQSLHLSKDASPETSPVVKTASLNAEPQRLAANTLQQPSQQNQRSFQRNSPVPPPQAHQPYPISPKLSQVTPVSNKSLPPVGKLAPQPVSKMPYPSDDHEIQMGESYRNTPRIKVDSAKIDGQNATLERAPSHEAETSLKPSRSELSMIYDKYSQAPFGSKRDSTAYYDEYNGDARGTLDISNMRDSTSTNRESPRKPEDILSKRISHINIDTDLDIDANNFNFDDDNDVFNPDYQERNELIDAQSLDLGLNDAPQFYKNNISESTFNERPGLVTKSSSTYSDIPGIHKNHGSERAPSDRKVYDYQTGDNRVPSPEKKVSGAKVVRSPDMFHMDSFSKNDTPQHTASLQSVNKSVPQYPPQNMNSMGAHHHQPPVKSMIPPVAQPMDRNYSSEGSNPYDQAPIQQRPMGQGQPQGQYQQRPMAQGQPQGQYQQRPANQGQPQGQYQQRPANQGQPQGQYQQRPMPQQSNPSAPYGQNQQGRPPQGYAQGGGPPQGYAQGGGPPQGYAQAGGHSMNPPRSGPYMMSQGNGSAGSLPRGQAPMGSPGMGNGNFPRNQVMSHGNGSGSYLPRTQGPPPTSNPYGSAGSNPYGPPSQPGNGPPRSPGLQQQSQMPPQQRGPPPNQPRQKQQFMPQTYGNPYGS